jgi:hypothetical protein
MTMKGKPITLGAKILAIATVYGGLSLKATIAPDLPFDDVLKAAAFAVIICAPVDLSLVIETIGQFIKKKEI